MGATLSRPLVIATGVAYPAYKTVLCLEDGGDRAERDQWLRYWVVYGAFRMLEYFTDRLVLWSPLYYPVKIATLALLVNPSTELRDKVYRGVVLPFVHRYRARIDDALERGGRKAKEVWSLAWVYIMKWVRALLAAVWFSSSRPGAAPRGAGAGAGEGVAVRTAFGAKPALPSTAERTAYSPEATPGASAAPRQGEFMM